MTCGEHSSTRVGCAACVQGLQEHIEKMEQIRATLHDTCNGYVEDIKALQQQVEKLEYDMRGLNIKLRRLGDDVRCTQIWGTAYGSARCFLEKDHDGDCDFMHPRERAVREVAKMLIMQFGHDTSIVWKVCAMVSKRPENYAADLAATMGL